MTSFGDVVLEMLDLYGKKNLAYGDSFHDSFNDWGIVGAMGRIGDKYNRLKTLTHRPDVDNLGESIEDTLIDMANYCVMTIRELRSIKESQIIKESQNEELDKEPSTEV